MAGTLWKGTGEKMDPDGSARGRSEEGRLADQRCDGAGGMEISLSLQPRQIASENSGSQVGFGLPQRALVAWLGTRKSQPLLPSGVALIRETRSKRLTSIHTVTRRLETAPAFKLVLTV